MSKNALPKASTAAFEGLGPVQIVAEMRKMQREKKVRKTVGESLDETLRRITANIQPSTAIPGEDERLQNLAKEGQQRKAAALWIDSRAPDRQGERKVFETDTPKGRQWKGGLTRARNRVENSGQIALLGGYGTGKTQIAVELIREATTRQKSALFVTATQLLREIKACYRDETKTTETEVVARYVKPWLLVIDEFHRRKGSEWENEQLFDIINQRYNALKPLVIICNQSRQEFDAAMDGAIVDRMNETGGIIECNWGSFRE